MVGLPHTPLTEKEGLASLRVLVCVAKANGELAPEKRTTLENAFTGLEMPANSTPRSVLDEKIDLDAQLRLFTTPDSRESLYQSALGMIHVVGVPTPAEQKMLDHIRTTLQISEDKASLVRRILDGAKETVLPSSIQPVSDPVLRATEIKSDVLKYSVLSGALGAFPIPGLSIATDLAVVCLQVKLVRDIGQRWGHKVDKQAAASLLGGLGLGTGARIAVSNLAKLIPVWGSAVGATASFASTWALGQIADKYFESGMKTAMAWSDFKAAEVEGRKAHDVHKDLVESKRKLREMALQTLGSNLKAGRITQQEYSARVEQLA
jgi:uncharacterized protein (DUF697 family)